MKKEILIVDYGMGNLHSVKNAFEFLGCNVKVSEDAKEVELADFLILPGVGSFRKAMSSIREKRLDKAIGEAIERKSIFLGICLGFQLCGTSSSEDGDTAGLGLIKGKVEKFSQETVPAIKTPHVGFNQVSFPSNTYLFKGMSNDSDFYFNHSFRILPVNQSGIQTTCRYGETFLAAYERDNIFATQFHPEKSQTNGLKLLRNFIQV
jgi:glutamine amidotransferase